MTDNPALQILSASDAAGNSVEDAAQQLGAAAGLVPVMIQSGNDLREALAVVPDADPVFAGRIAQVPMVQTC